MRPRFYVNIYTKQSQWEKPTAPVFPNDDGAPPGAPPGYEQGNASVVTDTKKNPYEDVTAGPGGSSQDEDAKLAARLQAEEDARARSGPGGPDVPAGYGGSSSPYPQQQQQGGSSYPSELPPRDRGAKSSGGGGFLGKLIGKGKQMADKRQQQQGGYGGAHGGGMGMGMGGGYPQQQYYPQQSHGGYPGHGPPMGYGAQPHYGGGYGAPGGYGGYGGGPGYGPPGGGFGGGMGGGRRPGGGGMGMAGGAALGAGAGLLGGAMLANSFDNDEQDAYQDGFRKSLNQTPCETKMR